MITTRVGWNEIEKVRVIRFIHRMTGVTIVSGCSSDAVPERARQTWRDAPIA